MLSRIRMTIFDAADFCGVAEATIRNNVRISCRPDRHLPTQYVTVASILEAWCRTRTFRDACDPKLRHRLRRLQAAAQMQDDGYGPELPTRRRASHVPT